MLESARLVVPINGTMAPQDDHLQSLVADLADRVREELRRELDALMAEARTLAESEREEAARHARSEAESAAATLVSNAIAAERASADQRLSNVPDEARVRERQSMLAAAERLLTSFARSTRADRSARCSTS